MPKNTVLIVDDDVKIAELLKAYFLKADFIPYLVHDGYRALQTIREQKPDIIILDLMLPGIDGWEICRQVRKEMDSPSLMLTARDEEPERLIGLEIGADDYVTKPFSPREVVARARTILRRSQRSNSKVEPIRAGNLLIDVEPHRVSHDGISVDLTPSEFKILELLASNPGRVFTRLQIVEHLQNYAFEGYERTIDAHIKNLRRKLELSKETLLIQTVYGVGYRFAGEGHA
jgi:DNA-binding response OmpR family regulator